jgi:hypothetical protein
MRYRGKEQGTEGEKERRKTHNFLNGIEFEIADQIYISVSLP